MFNNLFKYIDRSISKVGIFDTFVSKALNLLFSKRRVEAAVCTNYLYQFFCRVAHESAQGCGCSPCYKVTYWTLDHYVEGNYLIAQWSQNQCSLPATCPIEWCTMT